MQQNQSNENCDDRYIQPSEVELNPKSLATFRLFHQAIKEIDQQNENADVVSDDVFVNRLMHEFSTLTPLQQDEVRSLINQQYEEKLGLKLGR